MRVKLKGLVKEKGYTLALLSRRIKVEYEIILKLSSSKTKSINLELLKKICRELNVKPSEVIGE